MCQTIHRREMSSGRTLQLSKRCALAAECTTAVIGCHDTHINGIQVREDPQETEGARQVRWGRSLNDRTAREPLGPTPGDSFPASHVLTNGSRKGNENALLPECFSLPSCRTASHAVTTPTAMRLSHRTTARHSHTPSCKVPPRPSQLRTLVACTVAS